MFRDRTEAGRLLADRLARYADAGPAVVVAIPRGAVVIGAEISRRTGIPLDLVIVRKIGAPENPEFAVAAIDQDGAILENPTVDVSEEYLKREAERARTEIDRRLEEYRGGRHEIDVRDRTVILVDDGVATGLTALKAVDFLKQRGADRVVLAVPVIAREAAAVLRSEVTELIALEEPAVFWAVGAFYASFPQVSDDEVVRILDQERTRPEGPG